MCGIVFLSGHRAVDRIDQCLGRLRHRGPDDQHAWIDGELALGFARLAINSDQTVGRQPYIRGELVGAVNGEIYNHRALSSEIGLDPFKCDTDVILPLFEKYGSRVIDRLDGFYSAVILRPAAREAICLRDHIGKKPLFVGRSAGELFIASELKSLEKIDWFRIVPRGASTIDLDNGSVERIAAHRKVTSESSLAQLFEDAVRKRLPPPDQPIGVFLSGGLDSSLVASCVSKFRSDAVYFTLGSLVDEDCVAAKRVAKFLDLRDVQTVPLPRAERIPELVEATVRATESYNPSIVSNGAAAYCLASSAREAGIKVVLVGEGADELFCGYNFHAERGHWKEERERLIEDMQVTELRRLDMSCMAHSVEPRCPFLDRAIRSFSDGLSYRDMYDRGENKVSLRSCFEGELPDAILHRRKVSCDVGSGMRKLIVRYLRRNGRSEREELREIWTRHFAHDPEQPYFHSYPAFDKAIGRRGETHR